MTKKKSNLHPLLLLIVIIGIIWFTLQYAQTESDATTPAPQTSSSTTQSQSQNASTKRVKTKPIPYNFQAPKHSFTLKKALGEISGLGMDEEGGSLLAINDEKGKIYQLDLVAAKEVTDYKFAGAGDYEGVEKLGDEIIVVVRSDGKLYFYNKKTGKTTSIQTQLSSVNDVEGICYHSTNKQLLLACKGQALEEGLTSNIKSIYAFDLKQQQLLKNPYLQIKQSTLRAFLTKRKEDYGKKKFKKLNKRLQSFAPSGLAIHPHDGRLYVLSARGNLMVIFDPQLVLEEVVFFEEDQLPQAEGICFDQAGRLYISTEAGTGSKKRGRILRF